MTTSLVQSDPAELGFDPRRLDRIESHFSRYVEEELLPGFAVLVSRAGKVCYHRTKGWRDLDSKASLTDDAMYRIYSMTKPVTSVALMMLYEEGLFDLSDPVSKFLPEFSSPMVLVGGSSVKPVLRPASAPLLIWHLLTHTAGLSYGFFYRDPVDALYRGAGFEWGSPEGADLARCCEIWAGLPLLFDPGTSWNYSHATDVVGRLVEVISGTSLADFFAQRIFGPLRMVDTAFQVTEEAADRLVTLYLPDAMTGRATRSPRLGRGGGGKPSAYFGGSGLISTISDYHRFSLFLRGGGELDDVRLLSPKTVSYMARNHLPGGHDIAFFEHPIAGESEPGVGFGLGVSVVTDPAAMKVPASVGEYGWGGAASTTFWVDPVEDLVVIFMTQLLPSSAYPLRRELHRLVHQAITA
jgi:CubicO group peptidase (beta-lactamase class C family)